MYGGEFARAKSTASRVANKLADFCNKLPFSGKVLINPTTELAFRERNPYYKTIKAIEAEGLLAAMALAHTSQFVLGTTDLQQNIEMMKHNPSPEILLACSIDIAYSAANVAAIYAQLHLGGRLAENFMRTTSKAVPRLTAWGINGNEVDYPKVAENLITAIINEDQADIDTFFMVLPKDQKQKVMESVKEITNVVDEMYSYEEIDEQIALLRNNVEKKSKLRYLFDIVKNAHSDSLKKFKNPYSYKEQMKMLIVTFGGQVAFITTYLKNIF